MYIEPSGDKLMGIWIDLLWWGVATNNDEWFIKGYLGSAFRWIGIGPVTHLVKLGYFKGGCGVFVYEYGLSLEVEVLVYFRLVVKGCPMVIV